jgi:predicted dehydrogenase/nucleoside-diphosphate-sugar epimerase
VNQTTVHGPASQCSRVCIVGAGYIAQIHAEVLQKLTTCAVVSVVDKNQEAARRLAQKFRIPHVFRSVGEALAADTFDRAHVLVPPSAHAETALEILDGGKPVLVEKPLAASLASCRALIDASAQRGAVLGVNQNFLYHPAFRRVQHLLSTRAFGRPNHVSCIYNMPLRQLQARQFGHWMFQSPVNMLLEQAVHPLSQIVGLAGRVKKVKAIAVSPISIGADLPFYPAFDITLGCDQLPAQMRFAVGQQYPFWQLTVVCDDGVIVADIATNRVFTHGRTRFSEAVDNMASGMLTAATIACESLRNAAHYADSIIGSRRRRDPFFISMRDSISAFHAAVDEDVSPISDGELGAHLVSVCEEIRDQSLPVTRVPGTSPAASQPATTEPSDVLIIGGTGFIGRYAVKRFLDAGMRVAVMARTVHGLPPIFSDPRVRLYAGDTCNATAVGEAIGQASIVINLAHGGGGTSAEGEDIMVKGAKTVAEACLEKRVRLLVHVGSIAGLYLGPQDQPITGASEPDPLARKRAEYARGKAYCDRLLLELHAQKQLPVCILRPGVVVGDGGPPFHGGLGSFNNEQHCIGWNAGRNTLPFVLVEDVAEAIFLASRTDRVAGRCYNLVGDVRLSAREYISELGKAIERPLRYHPKSATGIWLQEIGKWIIKRCGGRKASLPARRDFLSRGMTASFDCSDAKRDLGWEPTADRDIFYRRAILVHAC